MKKSYLLLPLSILTIVSQSYIFSGKDFSFTKEVDNPYIVYGGFDIIEEATTEDSFEYSIEVVDNSTNDFYNSLVKIPAIMIEFKATDGFSTGSHGETSHWINEGQQPSDGIYYFYIRNDSFISPSRTFEVLSLNDTNLAVGDSSNPVDDEITIIDDLGVSDNTFTTTETENPYIRNCEFKITSITTDSVEFQLEVINDAQNSFIPEDDIDVTIKDDEGLSHQTTASYVGTTEENKYKYKITELEPGVPFPPSTHYLIYSLNNTGLATQQNTETVDEQLIIADTNSFGYFWTPHNNPYIKDEGFKITSVTSNSIEFQIKVLNNAGNSFVPENDLDVTLKDSDNVSHQTTASYVGTTGENKYTYKITSLESGIPLKENTTYQIYSLNNTGLAVGDELNKIDNEIIVANDLGVSDNTATTSNANPYIKDGGFKIEGVTSYEVRFQITIVNDSDSSFVPDNDIDVTLKDSDNVSHQTTAHHVGTDYSSDTYIYEITELEPGVPLTENTSYQIYSLNNTGLAINGPDNAIDDEIIIGEDIDAETNSTTTSNGNPYMEYGEFEITRITRNSVRFEITVINDDDNSFVPEDDIDVTLRDDHNVSHQTTASYVSAVDNTYTYEITELEPGVPLTENTSYLIYSLNNTGLTINSPENAIDDEIIIGEDLSAFNNGFTTSLNNPYITDGGFEITSVTTDSVQFQITVINDANNSFIPENNLSVTLKDSNSISHQTTASYVGAVGNTYTYEIDELETGVPLEENATYQIYSLNNTGLAIGNDTMAVDDEITIIEDLGVTDNNFTISSNYPYIEDGGFEITSVTTDSVQFQITVINDANNSFVPENDLSVTIKDSNSISHQTTASYVGAVGYTYTYEIDELETGVPLEENATYQIYSLNNTGLAVENNLSVADDEILIEDELHSNGDFLIDSNPYTEENDFEITSVTTDSVQFQITVINDANSSFVPENDLNVTLKDSLGYRYNTIAHYKEGQGNTYTYEINELEPGTPLSSNSAYQIYSLNNTGLAVNNGNSDIDDEILLQDDLGVYDNTFETLPSEGEINESSLNYFAITLVFLIFVLMAITFYIKILFGNKKKY